MVCGTSERRQLTTRIISDRDLALLGTHLREERASSVSAERSCITEYCFALSATLFGMALAVSSRLIQTRSRPRARSIGGQTFWPLSLRIFRMVIQTSTPFGP